MKGIVFLFSFLLFSQISIAADVEVDSFTIDKIRISNQTGIVYVMPTSFIFQKNESCSRLDLYAMHKDSQLFNQVYSALLTAATSGKSLKAWVSVDAGDCINNRQRLSVVEVDF